MYKMWGRVLDYISVHSARFEPVYVYRREREFLLDCLYYNDYNPLHWLLVKFCYLPEYLPVLIFVAGVFFVKSPFHVMASISALIAAAIGAVSHFAIPPNPSSLAVCTPEGQHSGVSAEVAKVVAIAVFYGTETLFENIAASRKHVFWRTASLAVMACLTIVAQFQFRLQDSVQIMTGLIVGVVSGVITCAIAVNARSDYRRRRGCLYCVLRCCGAQTRDFKPVVK